MTAVVATVSSASLRRSVDLPNPSAQAEAGEHGRVSTDLDAGIGRGGDRQLAGDHSEHGLGWAGDDQVGSIVGSVLGRSGSRVNLAVTDLEDDRLVAGTN